MIRVDEEESIAFTQTHDSAFAASGWATTAALTSELERADQVRPQRAPRLARHIVQSAAVGISDAITAAIVAVLVLRAGPASGRAPLELIICIPVALAIAQVVGLYSRETRTVAWSTIDEVPRLVKTATLLTLLEITVQISFGGRPSGADLVLLWAGSFGAMAAGRVLSRAITDSLLSVERCVVVGGVDEAQRIHERLDAGRARAQVVGALELSAGDAADPGVVDALREVVEGLDAHRIIVVPGHPDDLADLLRVANGVGVSVDMLPGSLDFVGSTAELSEVNGLRLIAVTRFGLTPCGRITKRVFDLTIASIGLLLASPLLATIALAIRLDSRGPILFKQTRVGRNGDHFSMFKFRSMVADAEARKDDLRGLIDAQDLFKLRDDPRVTRVGRLLRRASIDELPQLLNVLRGDMSLVGPRPLVIEEDAMIIGFDRSRLDLQPGITGPWQILQTRATKDEMTQIDYRYASNWSLWTDLKILLQTVPHVLRLGNL